MATPGCSKKEKAREKWLKKQKGSPDEKIRANKHNSYFWSGCALFVICVRGVRALWVSREPLKLILRFIRVVVCVVACVVICCTAFNYFSPSWKITLSGIIDVLLHLEYSTRADIFQFISISILLTPPPKSTEEKDEIKNEKNEIKNEKDAIKKEYAEV
ncbi:predicted protein [Meyerozyma guilliermondii ATCC 6260]|uniref:Uncharacterized protein n=1 Tax=Meyerozyma guilliermondii (strain ATCC 6260 / CBS 566 / DSM 6381 / JCM 1539 / NBRC 10279 / NRRL Y-324) TaxID=294746 RepID=A5DAG5_PICGU|nr:uncharacterized protein PGUG_00270 [Meyerozyma guilliermondii ATCC 6260]EDK36172.2 predicted protein [Meyerozyma guilliermondii ATCC 6260]